MERVRWTGLHRLLDSTTEMVFYDQDEAVISDGDGVTKQRESKRSWSSEEGRKLSLEEVQFRVRVRVRVRMRHL